jgi:CrcB protein
MPAYLIVMLGGAIGAGFRFHLSRVAMAQLGSNFPWGTWIANLLGGLLMGVLWGTIHRDPQTGEPLRLFLGVGVLGGFTTFSAFSFETFSMLQRGDHAMAASYAVSSVAGSVLLLIIGFYLTRGAG